VHGPISRRQFARLLAGVPCIAVGCARKAAPRALSSDNVERVERILRRLVAARALPGVSYSIGDAGATLCEGAFGLRTVDPQLPMAADTRCPLASVSQQVASAAAYLLQQLGELSVTAPVSKYLPEYVNGDKMKVFDVLTMRSGISADDNACEQPIEGRIYDSTLIANLNGKKLDFTPGRSFAYSNCGFDVVGAVVARVSGMPYTAFIDQHFFRPLGMTNSYALGSRVADPNFAAGYARARRDWKAAGPTPADAAFASSNLVSTADDMQHWNRSLLNATVLSRDSLRQMFMVPAAPGSVDGHYASGWFVEPSGVIWHRGALAGYGTVNMLIPKTGYAITVLGNTAPNARWKPEEIAREIYNAAALGPALPRLSQFRHAT
jgi:CubicO group peptidase (beta-lactamase class C family)